VLGRHGLNGQTIMTFACSEYKICLDGIRFRGRHGVSDSERDLPQDFLVTVEVSLPIAVLPHGDHLREVFDYDRVASLVVDVGTRETCRLLETLAQRVIERVLSDTPATRVSVSVTKSRPPTASSVDSVAVELVASRSALPGDPPAADLVAGAPCSVPHDSGLSWRRCWLRAHARSSRSW